MSEREIFKQYANLNEDELNTKSNKKAYGKNDVMIFIIKRFKGKKNR